MTGVLVLIWMIFLVVSGMLFFSPVLAQKINTDAYTAAYSAAMKCRAGYAQGSSSRANNCGPIPKFADFGLSNAIAPKINDN